MLFCDLYKLVYFGWLNITDANVSILRLLLDYRRLFKTIFSMRIVIYLCCLHNCRFLSFMRWYLCSNIYTSILVA